VWCTHAGHSHSVTNVCPRPSRIAPHRPAGARGNRPSTAAARSARQTGSAAGADFTVWILLAQIVRDHFWLMLLGAIAIGLPAALAAQWTYQCSAWINDGTGRCRRPRAGFMRRCHDHSRVMITQYDVAAGAAAVIAVINALILVAVFTVPS
jgi:hypothetical protein